MEGPAFGFRLSFPVEGEALGAAHCFFDTKAFCDNIRYNEDVVMCILSTYSIQLSHTLAQCGSVMGGHVLILHGSQSLREDEDASWIKYKKDRSHSGTVLVRYVGPTKTKYCAGRSLRAPALQSYDVVASQGVHHPKYMLVFTRTRLHVAITTSNLVSDRSLNATWSQTFARVGAAVAAPAGFGAVLEDFLRQVKTDAQQLRFCVVDNTDSYFLQQCLQAGAPVDGAGDDLFAWVLGAALVDRLATSFNFSEAEVNVKESMSLYI